MKKLAVALLLALAASVAIAQVPAKVLISTAARNGGDANCAGGNNNTIYLLIDETTGVDCDATGGGSVTATCICDGGSIRAIAGDADLSAYAPLAGADFTGPVTMSEDRGIAGDESISYSTELDDDIAAYHFDFTGADGDSYGLMLGTDGTTYGLTMTPDGASFPTVRLEMSNNGLLQFDAGGDGTPETYIGTDSIGINGIYIFGKRASYELLPCDASYIGSMFFDTTLGSWCSCDGTDTYRKMSDESTACTASLN